jgi:hypothetical protein
MGRDAHRIESEHQVRHQGAEDSAGELSAEERGRNAGSDDTESPLDQRDDGVERRRHRLQRQDECDQGRAGDQAVLQQLQPEIVRRQALRGDPGPDHRGDQKRGANQLREGATSQRAHWDGLPISAASPVSASVRAR